MYTTFFQHVTLNFKGVPHTRQTIFSMDNGTIQKIVLLDYIIWTKVRNPQSEHKISTSCLPTAVWCHYFSNPQTVVHRHSDRLEWRVQAFQIDQNFQTCCWVNFIKPRITHVWQHAASKVKVPHIHGSLYECNICIMVVINVLYKPLDKKKITKVILVVVMNQFWWNAFINFET